MAISQRVSGISLLYYRLFSLANSPTAEDITRSLAGMIAKDLQHLSIVKEKGLQDFVKTLDPKYKISSRKALIEWKLQARNKDCSSKVKKAMSEVDHVVLTTDLCFAHSLNLVVKDSLEAVSDLIAIEKKTSAIVSFFHQSTTATFKLKEIQPQQKFPQKILLQSVKTRWNSILYMWERLLEQKTCDAVTTGLCLLGKNSLCLSQEEWSEIG